MKKRAAFFVVIVILSAVSFYLYSNEKTTTGGRTDDIQNRPAAEAERFEQEGNLVRNNPGLEKDIWYLIYEKPGQAALDMKLDFAQSSICARGVDNSTCKPETLEAGSCVRVLGEAAGEKTVRVIRLEVNI